MTHRATHERIHHAPVRMGSSRNFGLVFAGVGTLFGVLALWRGHDSGWVWLGAAAVFLALALVLPDILWPLNRAWHLFGLALGRVVAPTVMVVFFFVLFTPIALLARASGKDPLRLAGDKDATTYWIPREPPGPDPQSMRQQF